MGLGWGVEGASSSFSRDRPRATVEEWSTQSRAVDGGVRNEGGTDGSGRGRGSLESAAGKGKSRERRGSRGHGGRGAPTAGAA